MVVSFPRRKGILSVFVLLVQAFRVIAFAVVKICRPNVFQKVNCVPMAFVEHTASDVGFQYRLCFMRNVHRWDMSSSSVLAIRNPRREVLRAILEMRQTEPQSRRRPKLTEGCLTTRSNVYDRG